MTFRRPLVCSAVLGLLAGAGCGDDPGPGGADRAGTAFSAAVTFEGPATTSPPIDVSTGSPVLVSTSGAVLLGGGWRPETGHPDPEVRLLDRATNTWRDLPPLPGPTYVFAGVAVDDVPYFLGSPGPDLPPRPPTWSRSATAPWRTASSTAAPDGRPSSRPTRSTARIESWAPPA